jgi:hypothetical protein
MKDGTMAAYGPKKMWLCNVFINPPMFRPTNLMLLLTVNIEKRRICHSQAGDTFHMPDSNEVVSQIVDRYVEGLSVYRTARYLLT